MKILISAGELSGDLHAGAITRAIKNINPDTEVFGMGGECLRQAGGRVLFDIKEHSVMGFIEIIKHLPRLYRLYKDFGRVMDEEKPDCFVTIDYPGLNMRLAKMAHAKNIPVVCFIPPGAWAWHRSRAKKVAQIATRVATIFPFEDEVYREAGAATEFVGHPLLDIVKPSLPVAEANAFAGKRPGHPLVLIMPGSRLMEIEKMLPILLQSARILKDKHPEIDFAMPRAGTIPKELLQGMIAQSGLEVKLTEGHNYDLFKVADLALATSGTVTLEAAILGLGSVICYRTGWLNAFIARLVLHIPHIGLPNIVAGRGILPEMLQEDFTPVKVAVAAEELLEAKRNAQMHNDLDFVRERLGTPGAVNRVAELILRIAQNQVSGIRCQVSGDGRENKA